MGARIAVARAPALRDSNRRLVSLEFSMAAIFPPGPRDLRGGAATDSIAIDHRSCHCAWPGHCDGYRSLNLSHRRHLCFSANMDLYRTSCGLVWFRIPATQVRISLVGTHADYVLRVARHVSLHPDKLRSSQI